MKKAFIILGLGYGDEGKGLVTDYLCNIYSSKSLVIRFNGGQQAGHTVVTNDDQHVFSNFGSGTFREVPTYWSPFCTFSPAYFLTEFEIIRTKPILFLDVLCPVTTHYDVLYNRLLELNRGDLRYGSCGLGFGSTIDRQKNIDLGFYVQDLKSKVLCKRKLKAIRSFYKSKIQAETKYNFEEFNHDEEDNKFEYYVNQLLNLIKFGFVKFVDNWFLKNTKERFDTYIFEGAQGILLDINYGTWPYITKSNTTSRNAIDIINANFKKSEISTEVFYVTRSYQTRHGSGPFEQDTHPISLVNRQAETNIYNPYQGEFRVRCLDVNDLNYSLACDVQYSKTANKNLVVTCLDQVEKNNIPIFSNGQLNYINYNELPIFLKLQFQTCKFSFSKYSDKL